MKKAIYSLIGLACLGFTMTGCVDLETAPYNQVASNNMWTNSSLTNQGVAGVYNILRGWGVYSSSYTYNTPAFEAMGVTTSAYRTVPYTKGTAGSGDGMFSNTWRKLYEGIHRANDAISNLSVEGSCGVTDDVRLRLLAECKFLRAYYYMRLNELFGRNGLGVPIYTEPLASVEECVKGQSPESEVWQLIVDDLTDCINESNFPNRYTESGRACKGAAYALRGRAYLLQGAKYNYDNGVGRVTGTTIDKEKLRLAVADFEKVQGCGFNLFQGGYDKLFTEENEACEEMIFSVSNYSKSGYGSETHRYCGTRSMTDMENTTGYSYFAPSNVLVDLYENVDGTPFDWNDIIPGYFDVPARDRLVYFLRDTKKDGQDIGGSRLRTMVADKLSGKSIADQYLPEGNEARLRKAWENRDPRLNFNVILPYGEPYMGGDPNILKKGSNAPIAYVYRWPVKQSSHHVDAQEASDWQVTSPYDLQQDGNGEAEFSYRYRKFVMTGYPQFALNGPIDEPILRYAYVLLMWSEALVQLDDLSGAAAKVNEVRGRTSVEMPPYTFANKEDGLEKLRNESRRELCGEGVNFYEELRWGTLRQTKYSKYNNYDAGSLTCNGIVTSGNGGANWSSTNDYSIFPVPSEEIEKNPNLTKTPGWLY